MTITRSPLTSGHSEAAASSLVTASISPGANRLVLATLINYRGAGSPATPTASGNGLTYVQVGSINYTPIATPRGRITCFRAMGASPSAGAVTFDLGGQSQDDFTWFIHEFDGVDTSGTNGSGAVVQAVTDRGDSDAAPAVVLAAFEDALNAAIAYYGSEVNLGTFGAGAWPSVSGAQGGAGVHGFFQFLESENTNCDCTLNSQDWGGIALELRAAAVASSVAILRRRRNGY